MPWHYMILFFGSWFCIPIFIRFDFPLFCHGFRPTASAWGRQGTQSTRDVCCVPESGQIRDDSTGLSSHFKHFIPAARPSSISEAVMPLTGSPSLCEDKNLVRRTMTRSRVKILCQGSKQTSDAKPRSQAGVEQVSHTGRLGRQASGESLEPFLGIGCWLALLLWGIPLQLTKEPAFPRRPLLQVRRRGFLWR